MGRMILNWTRRRLNPDEGTSMGRAVTKDPRRIGILAALSADHSNCDSLGRGSVALIRESRSTRRFLLSQRVELLQSTPEL
jgi:hypothetical protein